MDVVAQEKYGAAYEKMTAKEKYKTVRLQDKKLLFSTVGTPGESLISSLCSLTSPPDYIAPEVFSKKGYGPEVYSSRAGSW